MNTEMIISAITGQTGKAFDRFCCLCGNNRSIDGFTDAKKILSANFTDHNLMKHKDSKVICDFCRLALSDDLLESKNKKRCGLRAYSFFISGQSSAISYQLIEKKDKIRYLFEVEYSIPFILGFTDTGKKHISFKSMINYTESPFWVSCENCNVLFDRIKWFPIYKIIKEFFETGIFKTELLSCSVPPWKFEKYGLDIFQFQRLKQVKRTAQYQLIVNSLMKAKENQDENSSTD